MSDDGYGGGAGDDYDYESGPGCVTKKFSKIPFVLNIISTSDLMMVHLCVSFFIVSKYLFLVYDLGRRL